MSKRRTPVPSTSSSEDEEPILESIIIVQRKLSLLTKKMRGDEKAEKADCLRELEEISTRYKNVLARVETIIVAPEMPKEPQLLNRYTFAEAFKNFIVDTEENTVNQSVLDSLNPGELIFDDVVDLAVSLAAKQKEQDFECVKTIIWQQLRSESEADEAASKCFKILASNKKIGLPICIKQHWTLAVLNDSQIFIYDSNRAYSQQHNAWFFARGSINAALNNTIPFVVTDCVQQNPTANNGALYVAYRIIFWDKIQDLTIPEDHIRKYIEGQGRMEMRAVVAEILKSQATPITPNQRCAVCGQGSLHKRSILCKIIPRTLPSDVSFVSYKNQKE